MKQRLIELSPKVALIVGCCGLGLGFTVLVWLTLSSPSPATIGVLGLLLASFGALVIVYSLNTFSRQSLFQRELEKVREGLIRAGERNALGLVEIGNDASVYDYTNAIVKPDKLVILLNDGRTWVSVHRERLRKRFADASKETTIFLIHPNSPFVAVLARKGSTESESINNRIRETLGIIQEIKTQDSNIVIFGHYLYNTYAACIGDKEALVTPYFTSRGSRTVPVFRYEDIGPNCYFRSLLEDVERLKLDAAFLDSTMGDRSLSDTDNVIRMQQSSDKLESA